MMTEHTQPDRDPQAPRGPMTCAIDMDALRRMDMKELRDFRAVSRTVADVLCGLAGQPRFSDDDQEDGSNEAGRLIDRWVEFFCGYEQAAINVARAATPADVSEAEMRAWNLVGFEADMCGELPVVSALSAEIVRQQIVAERERRAA
ncbi:hypothetical protein [Mesorhizobium sp. NPDC059025]|uniref:hypothetical protein n=1 Tax=unclassified Mesorhizobium TaxID=325217 RepID=UPI0036924557